MHHVTAAGGVIYLGAGSEGVFEDVVFTNNVAQGPKDAHYGGAAVWSNGAFTMRGGTLRGNKGNRGSTVMSFDVGEMTVTDTIIADNRGACMPEVTRSVCGRRLLVNAHLSCRNHMS